MKETENKSIPPHWKTAKLGEVCKLKNGFAFSSKLYIDKGIPVIRISDIYSGIVSSKNSVHVYQSTDYENYLVEEGDILVAMSGATTGKFGIFKSNEIAYQNQRVGKFQILNKSVLSNLFLFYQIFALKRLIEKDAYGGAQPNISSTKIESMNIALPPLSEQRLIVAKIEELFSELDNAVETLKKAKEQLKVYRQAVLKWAFEGKLTDEWRRSQNDEHRMKNEEVRVAAEEKSYYSLDIGLPKKWKKLKLKEIAWEKDGLRRGPFGSAIKKEFFVNAGYKVYEQGNAINDDPYRGSYFINLEKYNELKNFSVLPNDLIVSCSGVTLGKITEIPIDAQKGIINQALLRIRLRSEIISNTYFIQYFRSAMFQKKILSQSQGSAMPNLVGIKDFKEIELLVPPFDEQGIIIQEIETRFSVADKLEQSVDQSLQQAEALRQSILKRAFEGRLVESTRFQSGLTLLQTN